MFIYIELKLTESRTFVRGIIMKQYHHHHHYNRKDSHEHPFSAFLSA